MVKSAVEIARTNEILPVSADEVARAEKIKHELYEEIANGFRSYCESSFDKGLFSGRVETILEKVRELCILSGDDKKQTDAMTLRFSEFCATVFESLALDISLTPMESQGIRHWIAQNAYSDFLSKRFAIMQTCLVMAEFPDVHIFPVPSVFSTEIVSSAGRRIRLHKNFFNESSDSDSGIVLNTALYRIDISFRRRSFLLNELQSLLAAGYVSSITPNSVKAELPCGNEITNLEINEN